MRASKILAVGVSFAWKPDPLKCFWGPVARCECDRHFVGWIYQKIFCVLSGSGFTHTGARSDVIAFNWDYAVLTVPCSYFLFTQSLPGVILWTGNVFTPASSVGRKSKLDLLCEAFGKKYRGLSEKALMVFVTLPRVMTGMTRLDCIKHPSIALNWLQYLLDFWDLECFHPRPIKGAIKVPTPHAT